MRPNKKQTHKDYDERFPRLFSAGCRCGVSIPEGWIPLVEKLMQDLEDINNTLSKNDWIQVAQIKEKWGGLRFYLEAHYRIEPADILIREAEKKSEHMCVICGEEAKMTRLGGWIIPFCREHFPEDQNYDDEPEMSVEQRAMVGIRKLMGDKDVPKQE